MPIEWKIICVLGTASSLTHAGEPLLLVDVYLDHGINNLASAGVPGTIRNRLLSGVGAGVAGLNWKTLHTGHVSDSPGSQATLPQQPSKKVMGKV